MSKYVNADLKIIEDQIQEMESSLNTLKSVFDTARDSVMCVDEASCDRIGAMSDDEIEAITEDTVDEIITFAASVDLDKRAVDAGKTVFEYKVDTIKEIKSTLNDIAKFEAELSDMREEHERLLKDYYEYLKSPEYAEKRAKRVEKLQELLKAETDPQKITKLQKTLNMYKSLDTFSFLFKRLAGKDSEKEIRSIIDAFFDSHRGTYVMNRFMTKCSKMGIRPTFYSACLNIEEKFLPEEYAPFNNLFLFSVMRFIAYSNASNIEDRTYASHIVMDILKLFSHEFTTQDDELAFVDVIKRFDDYMMPYVEEFKARNVTYAEHPARIERKKQLAELQEQIEKQKEAASNAEVDVTVEEHPEASEVAQDDDGGIN